MTDVSIILCTCNRPADLGRTLQAIARVRLPDGCRAEVLVVDNAPSGDTAAIAGAASDAGPMPVRYVPEPRRGKCYAYNTGLDRAAGHVLLFTDDDVRPPIDWIRGMCEPIVTDRADAVAGGVRIAPHLLRPWMTRAHRAWLASTEADDPRAPHELVGANMAFSRSVLRRVPGFDVELGPGALGFGDESLFSEQLRVAGYRLVSRLDVAVEHHFDPARLARAGFADMAAKHGRTWAYRAYHWEHWHVRRPRWHLLRAAAALRGRTLLRRREPADAATAAEGMPEWEMKLLTDLHFRRQWLVECRRPRLYDRHGLVKRGTIDAAAPPAAPEPEAAHA